MINKEYWKIADETKRRLFQKLRNFFKEEPFLDVSKGWEFAQKYQEQQTKKARKLILEEWKDIKKEYKNNSDFDERRLSGYLYEILYYLCTITLDASFRQMDLYWMGFDEAQKKKLEEAPPHFEPIPLYDIIPPIAYRAVNTERAYTPQLKGDFLIFYVAGPAGGRKVTPIALVDVKKNKFTYEKYKKTAGKWMAIACLRHGLIAEIAYPKKKYDEIHSLKDWKEKIICPSCGGLMNKAYPKCPICNDGAYLFTREDWKEL